MSEHMVQKFDFGNNNSNIFKFLKEEKLTNVTMTAEGRMIQAHKLILAASSKYFEELFTKLDDKHPVIVLKDVSVKHLLLVLEYMYCGRVDLSPEDVPKFREVAESLKINLEFDDEIELDEPDSPDMSQDIPLDPSEDEDIVEEMPVTILDQTMESFSTNELNIDQGMTSDKSSLLGRKLDYSLMHKYGPDPKKFRLENNLSRPRAYKSRLEKEIDGPKCVYCDRSIREKDRGYHQRYCWKNPNRIVSDCTECNRKFEVRSKLRQHMLKAHSEAAAKINHQKKSNKKKTFDDKKEEEEEEEKTHC